MYSNYDTQQLHYLKDQHLQVIKSSKSPEDVLHAKEEYRSIMQEIASRIQMVLSFDDPYKNIRTKESYTSLLLSGMFREFHPELTGEREKDKEVINKH